jgi:hypothetical protein
MWYLCGKGQVSLCGPCVVRTGLFMWSLCGKDVSLYVVKTCGCMGAVDEQDK